MEIPLLSVHTQLPRNFTDVVYLTNKGQMPFEIRHLLRQKKLSFTILSLDRFAELRQRTHLIGTTIIDAGDMDTLEHLEVGRIIQALETENIGVIVLTHRVERPVRSFSLSPTKTSFSMGSTVESISIDDLWVQIGVNLAYRKKSTGITSKPVVPAGKIGRPEANRLAQQLQATASLVENLTEEFRLAGQVQRDFLPKSLPKTEGFKWATTFLPAEWVSGDIYGIDCIDDDHVVFYIVDAVGHGMPAALLTIFVKQALKTHQIEDGKAVIYSPAEVMNRLNVRMSRARLSGYQFATCCYCLLELSTRTLTYARAGHPYPVLIRRDEPLQQLEVRGSLLGVFEQAEYLEESVQLQSGDKLMIYSDGAEPYVGGTNDQSQFVFENHFQRITSYSIMEIMDEIITLTKTLKINAASIDDVTLVGLEVI